MTVYIDVLLVLNLYINYFLVRGTSAIIRYDLSAKRCIFSASVGSIFSLVVLFPELPFWLTGIIKLFSGAMIVLAAFGFRNLSDYAIASLCFLIISFLYAGLMLGLWLFSAPFGMFYRNGTAYFDIPIVLIALFTAVAFGILRFIRFAADKRISTTEKSDIEITINGYTRKITGLADTGNSLTDPFNGKPIIICQLSTVQDIVPHCIKEYLLGGNTEKMEGLRLIPCHTIAGQTLIPIFSAEKITINGKAVTAMIGVCKKSINQGECLFNPKLISL